MPGTLFKRTMQPLLSAVLILVPLAAHAAVSGRVIRVEAPASSRMAVHEIEVWSGGENVVLKNRELTFAGTGYRGRDVNFRNEQRQLVDGVADLSRRGFTLGTEEGSLNPWLEIDLGGERPLDRIVLTQPLKPQYDDRALRLVCVLDEARRVVFAAHWDIRRAPFNQGVATLDFRPGKHPLVGRMIPAETAQWVPLGDLLEPDSAPPPPDGKQRQQAFAQRNSPAAIERLAREFCARLNLTKPELHAVCERLEQRDFTGTLDAYREHFLRKLQAVTFLHEHSSGLASYDLAGEDLLRNVAVVFSRFDVEAQRFTPGAIPWGHVAGEGEGPLDTARVRARAGHFQRPLLTAYRATGRPELLAQWAAITDDWGLNIRADLDRAKQDLRFYFVKDVLQEFNHLADELAQTARAQPEFARQLPGTTLARLLIPVLEEYPPSYWWPCRRTTFNHTYNALHAATATSRILDDFHAGQRLDRENRQHWERVLGMMVTQDGSMNEIGDEGHLFMHWRMGVHFNQMQKTPPPWFTPEFAAEFTTRWRQIATYPIRHLAPDGRGHRTAIVDLFDHIWELADRRCSYGNMIPRETIDSTAVLRHPEVAGILQSVFGAGRERAVLPPDRQEMWDKVTAYYGRTFTPPATASDWLPYAGLYYLRRSWEPDATFVPMICQPQGHPSVNGSEWNTALQVWDYGQPLFGSGPVSIDRQPQFAAAGQQTWWPGSKTVELATASEHPIPARWHTSPRFDYAESSYEGTYQRHAFHHRTGTLELDDAPVRDACAQRRVALLRSARLVIVTDAVRAPDHGRPRHYEMEQRFGAPELGIRGAALTGQVRGDAQEVTLQHDTAPGVTVRRFSAGRLNWQPGQQPAWWGRGATLSADTREGLLVASLVEPHRRTGEATVTATRDLSSKGVAGFAATLADGATLSWLATFGEPRRLIAGTVSVRGEGLLVLQRGGETSGLTLGAQSLHIGDQEIKLPATDFEFAWQDGRLAATTAIHRPIKPVAFAPAEPVFVESAQVTLASATPGVEIRYTADGSEPDASSPLYTAPLKLTQDTHVRARAFRPGVKAVPFTADGTQATVVSDARYRQRALQPAVSAPTRLAPGLRWELVEGTWFALFSHLHLPDVMPARAAGETTKLLDVTMRRGDGAFGVRYEGFLEVPADGVWTFHAPAEYVGASCEPGYDLRLWMDGEEWDLGQRLHGRGMWSVPLAQGLHRLLVTFADARHRDRTVPQAGLWRGYPTAWVVWRGEAPVIELSGPGLPRQPLPANWLRRSRAAPP